jgi:hypothetical protein
MFYAHVSIAFNNDVHDYKIGDNNNNNNNNMGTINSSDRIAATLYSLGTWFVSGIYL